jgi:hypothetical protein
LELAPTLIINYLNLFDAFKYLNLLNKINIMKKFYYYMFYRFADFYNNWGESHSYIRGCVITTGVILCWALTLINIMLSFLGKHFPIKMIYILFVIVLVPNIFLLTNKKYLELKEQWKDEKHRKAKGWSLFILALSSLIFCWIMG